MNTSDSVILIDSDQECEESFPKQKQGSRTRQSLRQQKPPSKPKPIKRARNSAIVIDEDDSFIIPKDTLCSRPVDNVSDRNSTCSHAAPLNSPVPDNSSLTEKSLAEAMQHRKTAKRGLAKRKQEQAVNGGSLPHKVSVYSQAVAEGFKNLLHGDLDLTQVAQDAENVKLGTSTDKSGKAQDTNEESEWMLGGKTCDNTDCGEKSSSSSIKIQSPSPPPPQSLSKRARGMNKTLTRAMKTLNRAKTSLNKVTPPRVCSHSRRDSDVIIVGEEDCLHKKIVVKVRYLTKVYRMPMKLNDPFHVLTSKICQEINEAEHDLGLFLHDRLLEATESPQSIQLSVADIVECHCIKANDEAVSESHGIELVIQCRNNKSKVTITANKRRPLSDVMQKYAQLVNADVNSFTFSFDGEDVEPTDTPSKLEMEDHDIIDVAYE